MSYTAYLPEVVIPIFIYYMIIIILSVIVSVLMLRKYIDRKTKATLYMSLVYIISAIILSIITIGLAEAIITGFFKEIYRLSLPLGYTLLIITGMILLIFARNITESKVYRKVELPLIIIGVVVIILLFLPSNWWGVPQKDYEGKLNTRLIVTLLLVSYNILIYLVMARIYYLSKNRTIDPVARFGFALLYYSMICMIVFLLLIVMDTLFIIFLQHSGYTIFIYLAWLFVIGFYVLSYLSLIMPQWVEKRIKK